MARMIDIKYLNYMIIIIYQMQKSGKKPSLFKQKIKQAQQNKQENAGFPAAVKLIGIAEEARKSSEDEQKIMNLNCDISYQKSNLIQSIHREGVISNEQITKIERQNWQKVNSMNEQERQEWLNMINSQLPQSFIKQLRCKSVEVKKEEFKQTLSSPKVDEPIEQQIQKWWDFINFNIQTEKLEYKEQISDNLVNITSLSLMIGSQNNQSKIVASRLIAKFISTLCDLATDLTRQLILIAKIPLHLGIILEKMAFELLEPMIKQARSTNFFSVYIQIITKFCQSAIKACKFLSKTTRLNLRDSMKSLRQKSDQFVIKKQTLIQLKNSLALIQVELSKQNGKLLDINWETATICMDFIIELSILQQVQPYYTNKYSTNMKQLLLKNDDSTEIESILKFLYEFVNKLILKKNIELYINLKMMRDRWTPSIIAAIDKFKCQMQAISIESAFYVFNIARFIGGDTWNQLVNKIGHNLEQHNHLWQSLLFNILLDLKGSQINQDDINSLNSMLNWLCTEFRSLKGIKLNANFIMNTLTQLFLNEDEFYSMLDQQILSKCINILSSQPEIDFNTIFNEEKLRTIIRNFSYNSFGNQSFAKLILYIAFKINPDLQAMVLREAILPYPQLFLQIEIEKSMKESIKRSKNRSNEDLKTEIKQKLNVKIEGKQNILLIYLSS